MSPEKSFSFAVTLDSYVFQCLLRVPLLPLFALSLGANTSQIGMIDAVLMSSVALLAIPCSACFLWRESTVRIYGSDLDLSMHLVYLSFC